MDRSPENHSGHSEQPEQVEKERETKEDGRYIVFYTFVGEDEQEGPAS